MILLFPLCSDMSPVEVAFKIWDYQPATPSPSHPVQFIWHSNGGAWSHQFRIFALMFSCRVVEKERGEREKNERKGEHLHASSAKKQGLAGSVEVKFYLAKIAILYRDGPLTLIRAQGVKQQEVFPLESPSRSSTMVSRMANATLGGVKFPSWYIEGVRGLRERARSSPRS